MTVTVASTLSNRRPVGLKWRSHPSFIVATIAVGLITDLFLYALFVPVLPFMIRDRIGVPPDAIQGQVSNLLAAYAGASVLVSPLVGLISDRLPSRQGFFLLGLISLLVGSVLLLWGRTMAILMVARCLQGASASIVWTVGLALCLETVGPQHMGKALGTIFSCVSLSTTLAPTLGGILYDRAGLTGVFGFTFALLAVDFTMRFCVVERKVAIQYPDSEETGGGDTDDGASPPPPQEHIFDEEMDPERTALLHGEGQSWSPNDADDDKAFQLSPEQPLVFRNLPVLACLAHPGLVAALFITFTQGILLGSLDATVPVVSKEYYGFGAVHAGLMMLPIGVANVVFGPVLGLCVDRFGTKTLAVALYSYLVPVLVCYRALRAGGGHQVVAYVVLLALTGIGLAGTGAPSVVEASTIVARYYSANPDFFGAKGPFAQLYSLLNCCFTLGLAVGPELAGRLRLGVGYGNMNAVLAGLCGSTAILSFLFIGGRKASA